jgi:putative hydrolase of the HAD superfamily
MDRLLDDVHDFLSDLRTAGIPVALVTNSSSRSQRVRLSSTGLDDAFDHVVISGELGVAKPDPAIFHEALESLDVPATAAWHIGDSLSTDVAGAEAAGLRSVWLNRSGRTARPQDPRASLETSTLDGLLDRLANWG